TRNAACHGLQPLSTANFATIISNCSIIRHVLWLERPHDQTAITCSTTKPGNKDTLANVRTGTLKHNCARHGSLPNLTSAGWQSAIAPLAEGICERARLINRAAARRS